MLISSTAQIYQSIRSIGSSFCVFCDLFVCVCLFFFCFLSNVGTKTHCIKVLSVCTKTLLGALCCLQGSYNNLNYLHISVSGTTSYSMYV